MLERFNKLNSTSPNFIKSLKFARLIVFALAMFFVFYGIKWASINGISSPIVAQCLVPAFVLLVHLYKFNKDLKENKIDGARAMSYFFSAGKAAPAGGLVSGIINRDPWLILACVLLIILFMFASVWIVWFLNYLNNLSIKVENLRNDQNDKDD